MRVYLKNSPAEFHPDPIWNDKANRKENKKNKMSSDMGSVSDAKIIKCDTKEKVIII